MIDVLAAAPNLANLSTFPAVLGRVDFARTVAELDRAFRAHGARSRPLPAGAGMDLLLAHRAPSSAMATFVLESDRIERAVVSHVRIAPFVTGVSVLVHPNPAFEAPMLLADFMVLPTGASRLFADAAGPGLSDAAFGTRFREPLVHALGAREVIPVPAWLLPLSGGAGGRLRAPRGEAESLAHVLVSYVEAYLGGLDACDATDDAEGNRRIARSVRDVVRAKGRASKYLGRAFGNVWADRYARVAWPE
ncbi:MAG: hypothetical protein U0169_16780 [Polyangiaceae bacterium]